MKFLAGITTSLSNFSRLHSLDEILGRNHHLSLKLLVLLHNGKCGKGGQPHRHHADHGGHPLGTSSGSELVNFLTLCGPRPDPLHLRPRVPELLLPHAVLAQTVLGGVLVHVLLPVLEVVLLLLVVAPLETLNFCSPTLYS